MSGYLVMRIMNGALDYKAVVTKYPQFKDDIDKALLEEGRQDLIS